MTARLRELWPAGRRNGKFRRTPAERKGGVWSSGGEGNMGRARSARKGAPGRAGARGIDDLLPTSDIPSSHPLPSHTEDP